MTDLKPCPFCGSDHISEEKTEGGWPVAQCDDCGAQGPCIEIIREKANAAWNERALSPLSQVRGDS